MCVNERGDSARRVREAIDKVCEISCLRSYNRLAGKLDVSKQALSRWRSTGVVPAMRACQMELITKGQVTWRELCPDIVEDVAADRILGRQNRGEN